MCREPEEVKVQGMRGEATGLLGSSDIKKAQGCRGGGLLRSRRDENLGVSGETIKTISDSSGGWASMLCPHFSLSTTAAEAVAT